MTQHDLQAALREQRQSQRHKAVRYPDGLRTAVAEFVRTERSRGLTLAALAESLDLPINTLRRWCERLANSGRLKPVEVVTTGASDCPVLVTPSGHRVEGLTMSDLAGLLERLG